MNATTEPHGENALHYAVRLQRGDLIRVLVQAGADIHLKDNRQRETPYELAISTEQHEMVRLLKVIEGENFIINLEK